MNNYNSSAK